MIRKQLLAFVVANGFALVFAFVAVSQAWIADVDDVPRSLVTRWLPLALILASLLTAAIALHLDNTQREGFLLRHFALFLSVPAILLFVRLGPVSNGELGVIYIGIALALALHALAGVWSALDQIDDRRVALLLGATMLAVGLVVLPYDRTVVPTASDEPHYLIVAQSLVLDHDLDLANDYAGTRYLEFYPEKLPDIHGIVVGNAIYSIRDLGLPLLAVVPFAIAGRTGVMAMLCLAGALLAIQLYLMLRDLRFDRRVAFLAVAVTALVHPILTYTTQIYPDLIAALVFVSAARLMRRGMLASMRDLALASALTGTLPWLSTRAWFIAVGIGLVMAYCALWPRRDLLRRIAAGALPFAALVLALAYLNWREFGLFIPSAGYFLLREQQPVLVYTPWIGGIGLIFDGPFGLIPRAAVYLLAFVGAVDLWRRARDGHGPEIAALAIPWALSFLYIASIAYWYADGGPASRYLLATLPFLIAAVAGGIETILAVRRGRDLLLGTAAALVAWSAFITYVLAVLPELRYDYAPEIRAGAAARLWVFLGRILRPEPDSLFPSLLRTDMTSVALSLVWVAVALALLVVGPRLRARVSD
ncbi:MAG: hypothetical protein E6H91_00065 [Chloroflexi bacterium]|nr:MAG: hypothetical protein E6H91_00065 [Chloroflexota bacterium]